jgi:nucleotide-binding universal stress UspA family protein
MEVRAMLKVNKLLFACDLTENASKILPYVLSLAEKYDSQIYLIHVVHDLQRWGNFFIPHSSTELYQKEAMEGAEKALNRACEEDLKECQNFKKILVSGDPASKILEAIESEGIDMVVLGTHGRKGLEHVVFGSVAENVVRKSPVPVLSVNPHTLK